MARYRSRSGSRERSSRRDKKRASKRSRSRSACCCCCCCFQPNHVSASCDLLARLPFLTWLCLMVFAQQPCHQQAMLWDADMHQRSTAAARCPVVCPSAGLPALSLSPVRRLMTLVASFLPVMLQISQLLPWQASEVTRGLQTHRQEVTQQQHSSSSSRAAAASVSLVSSRQHAIQ
jgi:hypothetical protein